MGPRRKAIYRITYPNGKIYVGMGLTGSLLYFGSVDARLVEADCPLDERRDFTLREEILWESDTATDAEVRRREVDDIRALRVNDPRIGYNRLPRCRPERATRPPIPAPPIAHDHGGAGAADPATADRA